MLRISSSAAPGSNSPSRESYKLHAEATILLQICSTPSISLSNDFTVRALILKKSPICNQTRLKMQRDRNCSISADLPRVDKKRNSRVLISAWSSSRSMPVQYKRVSCKDFDNRSRSIPRAFSVNFSAMTAMESVGRVNRTFTDTGFCISTVVPAPIEDTHELRFTRVTLTPDPKRGFALNIRRILSRNGETWPDREMLSPDR